MNAVTGGKIYPILHEGPGRETNPLLGGTTLKNIDGVVMDQCGHRELRLA